MKSKVKDYFVIGFALFAMFFGAGNLIFPPTLGRAVGSKYLPSILGFLATGVGLPLMGILSCIKSNGDFMSMAGKVGKDFSLIITSALILAIGPMLAIPRTAATTFELSLQPFFPNMNPFVAVLLFFLINLAFVLKPNSIIDNIGKFLTPVLLIMLSLIIIKGIVCPIGEIYNTNYTNVFSNSLLEGYQTMDAMASVIFASIIISSVKSKGYKTSSEIARVTVASSIVAVIGLSFIYGGLLYLGAQTNSILPGDTSRTRLVSDISKYVLGNFGTIALSISVGLACLTTSIGLTSTGADFFTKLSKGKISYTVNVFIITIISMIISLKGVDIIVSLASPILQILYPVVIILIVINLLENFIKNNKIIAITVYTALIFSILSTVNSLVPSIAFISTLLNSIPLSNLGFAWFIPSLIAFFISCIAFGNKEHSISQNLGQNFKEVS